MHRAPLGLLLVCAAALVSSLAAGCSSDGDGAPAGDPGASPQDDSGTSPQETSNDATVPAEDDASTEAAPPMGDAGHDDAHAPPDVDQIPWTSGANVGFGVASKDTQNPSGTSVFIGYAGYNITLDAAKAWVTALYRATLKNHGVRYIYAVQGPSDPTYTQKEIGNSKIIAAMLPKITAQTKAVLVLGHSSGSFVAHELLGELQGGADPQNITANRVVYFDLDGGQSGLDAQIVARLRRAYFVGSHDGLNGTFSPNNATMQSLGSTYASAGGYIENDASGSGCNAGATWCVHVTLVITKPHNPADADPAHDYSDFVGRPVSHAFIEAKATAAGL